MRSSIHKKTSCGTRSSFWYSSGSSSRSVLYRLCCTPRDFSCIHGFTQHRRFFLKRSSSSSVSSRAANNTYLRLFATSISCSGSSSARKFDVYSAPVLGTVCLFPFFGFFSLLSPFNLYYFFLAFAVFKEQQNRPSGPFFNPSHAARPLRASRSPAAAPRCPCEY